MRAALIRIHRYLSLTLLAVWGVQALTGVLNVFHRELGDAVLGVHDESIELAALAAGVERLEAAFPRVSSMYAAGGAEGQFDVFVRDADGAMRVVRLDARGNALRERPWAVDFRAAGLLQSARLIHETLLAGDLGKTLIGVSGLLLLTNIALGLKLAWARAGTWRSALWPARAGRARVQVYAWHRALGLWFAVVAIVFVSAGVLTAFGDPLEARFGPVSPPPAAANTPRAAPRVSAPEQVLRIALARYPDARISILSLPDAGTPWYRVRLLQPGERRRVFGNTTLYIDKSTGEVLLDYDAFELPWHIRVLNAFYAVHTGEWFGAFGRVLSLATGVWLLTMLVLGTSLWWLRRRASQRRAAAASPLASDSTARPGR